MSTLPSDQSLNVIQKCSGITCGRVLSGELHAQKLKKLMYLHLFTDCFNELILEYI